MTRLPLDVHLMIEAPDHLREAFTDAGADVLTVHQEACVHLHRTIGRIRELGARPGVSINPATPVATLDEILPFVDLVLIMSVNAGFAGQRFIPASTAKVAAVRRALSERGLVSVELEVDGGIAPDTARHVVAGGASCSSPARPYSITSARCVRIGRHCGGPRRASGSRQRTKPEVALHRRSTRHVQMIAT